MTRISLFTFILGGAIASLVGSQAIAEDPALTPTPNKVGVILPLTGDFAYFGEEAKAGMLLAVEDLKAKGLPVPQLMFEDDKCLAVDAVTAMKRLIDQEHVTMIIGPACSTAIQSTAPVAIRAKLPVLFLLDTGPSVLKFPDPIFSLGFDPTEMARNLAHDLKKRGIQNLALIHEEEEYANLIATNFESEWQLLGGAFTSKDSQLLSDTNFRPTITRALVKHPEAIFFSSAYESGNFLKQLRTLDTSTLAYGNDTMCVTATVATAGAAAEGARCANVIVNEADPLVKELRGRLKQVMPKVPDSLFYTGLGYESIILSNEIVSGHSNTSLPHIFKNLERNELGAYSIQPSILEIKNGALVQAND